MAAATSKKRIAVSSDSNEEFVKFYKTMIQWVSRHPEERVKLRKDGSALYVWIVPDGEPYPTRSSLASGDSL